MFDQFNDWRLFRRLLHAADQQLALVDQLFGQMRLQIEEQLLVGEDFLTPGGAVGYDRLKAALASSEAG